MLLLILKRSVSKNHLTLLVSFKHVFILKERTLVLHPNVGFQRNDVFYVGPNLEYLKKRGENSKHAAK